MNSFILKQRGLASFFIIVFLCFGTAELFGQLQLSTQLGTSGQDSTLENSTRVIMPDCLVSGTNDLSLSFGNAFPCPIIVNNIAIGTIADDYGNLNGDTFYNEGLATTVLSGETLDLTINDVSILGAVSIDIYVAIVLTVNCPDSDPYEVSGTITLHYEFCEGEDRNGEITNIGGAVNSAELGNNPKGSRSRMALSSFDVPSPNPTTGDFQFNYTLEEAFDIDISIYNSIGQKMKTLVNEKQDKGIYNVSESLSSDFPKGIYYVVYNLGTEIRTFKLMKL